MLQRLKEEEIWNLSPSEQDLVFSFIVQMMLGAEDLQAIFAFASQDPDIRTRLVVACLTEARRRGVPLVSPGDPSKI
jgi:hypothetical protein